MSAICATCPQPLDRAAVLCGESTCTDCERKAIARGIAGRDRGQAIASAAHPDDRAKVETAIRQLAAAGRPFSANEARLIHGVKGGVVGAAFTAMNKAGVIRPVGDETSTDAGTHGHRIYRWIGAAA